MRALHARRLHGGADEQNDMALIHGARKCFLQMKNNAHIGINMGKYIDAKNALMYHGRNIFGSVRTHQGGGCDNRLG